MKMGIFRIFKRQLNFKVVRVKITYPCFYDIIEEVDVNVPVGLNEGDENKYIDDFIEQEYAYLYGR